MSKLSVTLASLTGIGVTALGVAWFYSILYNWLWLSLIHSTTTGSTAGFVILFVLCICVTPIVCFLLFLGYGLAITIWND